MSFEQNNHEHGYLPAVALYGAMTHAQREALLPYILDQTIMDLGAADMSLSRVLKDLGALAVIAVDKALWPRDVPEGVIPKQCSFEELETRTKTVFVSWPLNYPTPGLVKILKESEIVAYLGKNTDGTVCGSDEVWTHLRTREVLAYVPDRKNVLTIYGPKLVERPPTGEERGTETSMGIFMSYEEVEREPLPVVVW